MVALNARAGELTILFEALSQKLNSAADSATFNRLLPTWIVVESSLNKDLSPDQRLPQYLDLLYPTSGDNQSLLIEQLEEITQQDFDEDIWKFVDWMRASGLTGKIAEVQG